MSAVKTLKNVRTIRNLLAVLGYRLKKQGYIDRIHNLENGRYCIENESEQAVDFYSVNGVLLGTLSYDTIRELAQ